MVSSQTGRGLRLLFYSEFPLLLGLLAFLLLSLKPIMLEQGVRVLVTTVAFSLMVGAVGLLLVWQGRKEFGSQHARCVNVAVRWLLGLGFLLILVAGQLGSFASAKDDSWTPWDDDQRGFYLRDLRAPVIVLGLLLLADGLGIHYLLRGVTTTKSAKALKLLPMSASVFTLGIWIWGWIKVDGYIGRSGDVLYDSLEARSYLFDFHSDVLRPWALLLLALRPWFFWALQDARHAVAQAEAELASSPEWGERVTASTERP